MIWTRRRKRRDKKSPPAPEVRSFEIETSEKPIIFRASGSFGNQTPNLEHVFECRKLTELQGLQEHLPFSKRGIRSFFKEERRKSEVIHWGQFLAWNPLTEEPGLTTHEVYFGYTILSAGTKVPILHCRLNFTVPGQSTDGVAERCCLATYKMALSLEPKYIDGILVPNRILTQPKIEITLYWLCWLYHAYRFIKTGNR